ncbi:hypothetical protein HAX54_028322 [Datura stramonium]|uniref:Uncharacterized protein n=1 Tax=Datura stramonium TaxID=4076 RepID=A0ABS8S9F7_DATST|nr:hypothetical protein [Datura stramonium]
MGRLFLSIALAMLASDAHSAIGLKPDLMIVLDSWRNLSYNETCLVGLASTVPLARFHDLASMLLRRILYVASPYDYIHANRTAIYKAKSSQARKSMHESIKVVPRVLNRHMGLYHSTDSPRGHNRFIREPRHSLGAQRWPPQTPNQVSLALTTLLGFLHTCRQLPVNITLCTLNPTANILSGLTIYGPDFTAGDS